MKQSGRFGADGTVELCEGDGEFTIRSTKPGTVTIGSFLYPLRTEGSAAGKSGSFLSEILTNTADRVDTFRRMVEGNLFIRPLTTYKALSAELGRYQTRTRKG